jgi:predicted RNA binding protein YcfA (HicA-like mRNA interferase family)
MTKLSPVSWKKFEKFLFFVGCSFEREKGDHRIYWREGLIRPIVIPKEKNLPIFIIRNNLRTLGMTIEEYMEILKNL